jgi:AcrR family transcriptional regulator
MEAGRAVLVERGYEATTMQEIAARAGASKETLYVWFGSKEGFFRDIVAAEGAATLTRLDGMLRGGQAPNRDTLQAFARALLRLLCGPWSIAVNRSAMSAPALAEVVLSQGRHAVGPRVEQVLSDLDGTGLLRVPDPAEAFRVLYGLVVLDTQIRVLLREPTPSPEQLDDQADRGVDLFWTLHAAS